MSTEKNFGVEVLGSEQLPVFELRGELDAATAPQLMAVFLDAVSSGAAQIQIDLAKLRFIDSSGMSALIRIRVAANAIGVRVALRGATGAVMRALEIARLLDLFET
jgi:anti-sigma B factor antagonist